MELKKDLFALSNAYGGSGREHKVSKLALEILRPYVDEAFIDKLGNVVGYKSCKKPNAKRILLDAHLDQVSLIVTGITEEGFLRFNTLSIDRRMLPASNVVIDTESGLINGVITCTPFAVSINNGSKAYAIKDLFIDIGMTKEQAEKVITIGDFVYYNNEAVEVGGKIVAKAMDDRACFMSIVYALDQLKDKDIDVDIIISASTKEETGSQGAIARAYVDNPDFVIAIDVSHAKTPDASDQYDMGAPIIAIGPQSTPKYARQILEVARAKEIKTQLDVVTYYSGTNGDDLTVQHDGAPGIVVSLPLKYMHTPAEMIQLSDVEATGKLVAEYIRHFNKF